MLVRTCLLCTDCGYCRRRMVLIYRYATALSNRSIHASNKGCQERTCACSYVHIQHRALISDKKRESCSRLAFLFENGCVLRLLQYNEPQTSQPGIFPQIPACLSYLLLVFLIRVGALYRKSILKHASCESCGPCRGHCKLYSRRRDRTT